MTIATTGGSLCGHTWWAGAPCLRDWHCRRALNVMHRCDLLAEHATDPGPVPRPHRCRCDRAVKEVSAS